MSDDERPDERDERTAGLLEVPPLDDLTRRRLVQRALAEAGPAAPHRSARWLRVAAAAVTVVLVGGVAALVLRDGDDTTRDASRAADESVPQTSGDGTQALDEAVPATVDLGAVPGPAALRDRLEGLGDLRAPSPAPGAPPAEEDEATGTDSFAGLPQECVTTLLRVDAAAPLSVVGTAVYQGSPALVVVEAGGERAFVLDRTDPAQCPVLDTVALV